MYLKEISMAQDRLRENIHRLIEAKIHKEVSEKLGILIRDLNSFSKGLDLPKSEETELQAAFLDMIARGCEEFRLKMISRIPIEVPLTKTPSE